MDESEQPALRAPLDFFPMGTPREKQIKALDFVRRAHALGYRDIVVEAPTGIGKSGIGAAVAFWAAQVVVDDRTCAPGAYYLVTQKLLQDQLTGDVRKFLAGYDQRGASLKSAIEYRCDQHLTCYAGFKKKCKSVNCPYQKAKAKFNTVPLSITNYPYFFTEHIYVGSLPPRRVLVLDECHTLEKQILGFVELAVNQELVSEWAPHLGKVPALAKIEDLSAWLDAKFMPIVIERTKVLRLRLEDQNDRKLQDELAKAENFIGRMNVALEGIESDPQNWVYWQTEEGDGRHSLAKPISAVPFVNDLVRDNGGLRVYMSAYPGPKSVFCRNLGLEPKKVAWSSLASTFPIAHRPVHLTLVGSMGKKSIEQTLPSVQRMCSHILKAHAQEKGLIHCHSYKLGDQLYRFLSPLFPNRILFPHQAKERDEALARHAASAEPTVLLSPSMTEGFNLMEDLARFQIITKMPYPYLGDKQVEAKKELDPEWYVMQTIMTVIQACGRIVRSDTDTGVTYILDSDFNQLYSQHQEFFPRWFEEAFVWHKTT